MRRRLSMITIPGQLAIRTIVGRNGDFNVGRLTTSIGEFVVKDPQLDQYQEGKYDGQFVVTEIKPSSYSHRGALRDGSPCASGRHDTG